MASSASAATAPRTAQSPANEAILRNALRYTISASEYAALHKYVLSKSRAVRRRVPSVDTVDRIMNGPSRKKKGKKTAESASDSQLRQADASAKGGADDFNSRAVRHALRVFIATASGLQVYQALQRRIFKKKPPSKEPLHKSPTLRLSLSLSAILLLYRLLFRFFTRLRATLLDPAALPFRVRNPRTAAALTSPYAPAAGASLAGLALGMAPARFRLTIAIMAIFRGLEFAWNAAEDSGAIWGVDMVPVAVKSAVGVAKSALSASSVSSASLTSLTLQARPRPRPWWWGSWMLSPLAFGQLLHAAVFDRDCFPLPYGNFIFNHTLATNTFLHPPPADVPAGVAAHWPGPYAVVNALAAMAKAHWPAFASPALFPGKDIAQLITLPSPPISSSASAASAAAAAAAVAAVRPLAGRAHPLIKSLSCATLHPDDPSCGRTLLMFWLRSFPSLVRFFLVLYTALQIPRLPRLTAALHDAPLQAIQRLVVSRALRSAAFATNALATSWASICFFQAWLPRRMLSTQRFFLGGFLGGLWGWLERRHGRALFLYSARASVESLVRVGVKRGWWQSPSRGGDVVVFVAALLLIGTAYEQEPRAVREPSWRKGVSWIRGEGWRDWAVDEDDDGADKLGDDDDESEGASHYI